MALIGCAQEMIHIKQSIKFIGPNVNLSTTNKVNKRCKDLVSNWSRGGHVSVRIFFETLKRKRGGVKDMYKNFVVETKQ
jgi:hypothetical protein